MAVPPYYSLQHRPGSAQAAKEQPRGVSKLPHHRHFTPRQDPQASSFPRSSVKQKLWADRLPSRGGHQHKAEAAGGNIVRVPSGEGTTEGSANTKHHKCLPAQPSLPIQKHADPYTQQFHLLESSNQKWAVWGTQDAGCSTIVLATDKWFTRPTPPSLGAGLSANLPITWLVP